MNVDEMLAQILRRSERSTAVATRMIIGRRLVHGSDVFLQVIKVGDEFGTVWTLSRDLARRGRARMWWIGSGV